MSGARGSGECKCTLEHSVLTTHRLRCRFSAQPGGFGFRHTPFDVFQRAVSHVLRPSKNGLRRMVCLLPLAPNTYPSSSFLLNHGFRRRLIQHGAYPGRHFGNKQHDFYQQCSQLRTILRRVKGCDHYFSLASSSTESTDPVTQTSSHSALPLLSRRPAF